MALRHARQLRDGRVIFGVDCLNLLRAIAHIVSGAAVDDGLDEDFTTMIDLLRREEHPTEFIKVKAHAMARYGRGDTPMGNIMADSAANRGTRDGTPPVPPVASRAGPAGPPAPPSVSLVKRADGESLKRDALEAFALEHVLDTHDAKRRNTTTPSIRQAWATIAREAKLRIDVMPKLAKLKTKAKFKVTLMRGRSRTYFTGRNQPCLCCGKKVNCIAHWRLHGCNSAASRYSTDEHNKLVHRVAEAIAKGISPPTYMFVNAGSKQRPSEWTVPQELLPHLPQPGQRAFSDTPDIMCVWVGNVYGVPAWGGPGTPVLHPAQVRLLPIEVAATFDLTAYRPDTTIPGSTEKRPYGGLNTTQEIKESKYFLLMLALAARGYDLVGVPAPSLPLQPSHTPPVAPTSRRIHYPYWIPDQAGRRYDIPKIHTIILGVLGSIPDSAVRAADAAGATADSALWHDITDILAAGLHGSFSIPAQARRATASSSTPQPQPPGGVG